MYASLPECYAQDRTRTAEGARAMTMKSKVIMWAVKRELERHGDDIRAEMDRLKSIRTLDELKSWAGEKGGALRELVRRHGPEVLAFVRRRAGDLARGAGRRK